MAKNTPSLYANITEKKKKSFSDSLMYYFGLDQTKSHACNEKVTILKQYSLMAISSSITMQTGYPYDATEEVLLLQGESCS